MRASDGSITSAAPQIRERLERIRDEVLAGAASVQPRGFEEALLVETPDGNRALLPRASAISSDEGRLLGVTVVLQDITRLRRFDELKDDLVATVAHEFRTPLTSLRMAIHLLAEQTVGPLDERQLDLVTAAREECERLQSIVDDLLDLARIRSGQLELHPRSLSSHRAIGEAVESVQAQADQAGVTVSMEVDPAAASITADPDRIELALGNLLINAVRHSHAGGQVTVHARRGNGGVRIEVQDEGPGIAPEHQARLFERFYRVPGLTARGSGARALHRPRRGRGPRGPGGSEQRTRCRGPRSGSSCPISRRWHRRPRSACASATGSRRRCPAPAPPPPGSGVAASTRRMCSRSICSRVKASAQGERRGVGGGDALGEGRGGRRSAGQTMAARSTALRSSRTLPGQP